MSVSATIGPVSGIDYGLLITGLTALDSQQISNMQTQVSTVTAQENAFTSLSAELTSLQISATSFAGAGVFNSTAATSSNPSVVSATSTAGTALGSYNFTVQQLATSSQLISQGFASSSSALGLAGNLTFAFGNGQLNPAATLANLNGGAGVSPGSIRITDRTGATATVNLSNAITINDVVNAINSATSINVQASIQGDHLVLTDQSGGTATNLSVANVGSTTTASDLGLTQTAVGSTLTGSDINKLSAGTSLNLLNDGNGVNTAGILNDFQITTGAGSFSLTLNGAQTLGDVINKINTAAAAAGGGTANVTAALSPDGHSITLTDADSSPLTVTALNNSGAAQDLGILGTSASGTLTGNRINGGLNSVLLSDLNGGAGLNLGTIQITNRAGASFNVDLSSAKTVNDLINTINNNVTGVTASLNSAGNGIALTDTTGATASNLAVSDVTGSAATTLGLAQSVQGTTIDGGNADLRVISDNTALSTLNAGSGFTAGSIQLTDSAGKSFTVNLSGASITTIGSVINAINQNSTGIRASINAQGNGLLLTDTSGGTGVARVSEVGTGSTASSLNILGTFTNGQLDGSFQNTVVVAATDTLANIVAKINQANIGVAASIINDGSAATPYHLSLVSRTSGAAGNLVFDGSALGINTTALSTGQNAVITYGGSGGGGGGGLQATPSTNSFTGLVPGLTVNVTGVGSASVNVAQDTSQIASTLQSFVTSYNQIISNIATLTSFDPTNPSNAGILFGNSTIQQIQQDLGSFISNTYSGVGQITTLAGVGITLNQDGSLSLNTTTLNSVLATDPSDISSLFTTNTPAVAPDLTTNPPTVGSPAIQGVGAALNQLISKYTDAQTGIIFATTDSLSTKITQMNAQITSLNALLTAKKDRMINQFANLEVTIAGLQQQGTAISNYAASVSGSTATKSTSSGSSSTTS